MRHVFGENVKSVKRGQRKDCRRCYLNLRPRVTELLAHGTFEQFRENSLELGGGWCKISDQPNSVSFLRYLPFSFNNQRITIEVKLTQASAKIGYALISHGCETDIANFIDISSLQRYPLTQRIGLILAFIDSGHLCKGTTWECGETTSLTHTSGKYVDLTQWSTDEGETRVFSDNCNIVTTHDRICCVKCRRVKRLGTLAKRRRLANDTIHPNTNERYLSKSEVLQQLAKERQARYNAEKRERYWKEKFNPQCNEMDQEDHADIFQLEV
ncbi:uncharacterized protein [Montipora capricornis]|uniref:uncharacterized protein n=1 Tax=Montipora capricornis TaxID=246305 RepID=UPI0035F1903F